MNTKYEEIVSKAKTGTVLHKSESIKVVAPVFSPVVIVGRVTVGALTEQYLNRRSDELRHGGYKSVRFSVGLFASTFGPRPIGTISREDALGFTRKVAQLGCHVGKSYRLKGASLDRLIGQSDGKTIGAATQRRTVGQASHFMDWAVYEGEIAANPFKTVRVEAKGKPNRYEVLSDDEVARLLALANPRIGSVLSLCLLSGMRAGEASGLVRDDLVWKGNLGWFAWIRPNAVRSLKTDAAERLIPLHSGLSRLLDGLPKEGRLFPSLSVNTVTKQFAVMRGQARITRQGVVFHSSRKWFVTQCERAGVPEHFTASIVGHQSARSENRMTYGIYSAGISNEQKREIVEKVGVPWSS